MKILALTLTLMSAAATSRALDWYGLVARIDHYSGLIRDAPSEEVERILLRAARLDPRITPAQWHWLRGVALDNDHD